MQSVLPEKCFSNHLSIVVVVQATEPHTWTCRRFLIRLFLIVPHSALSPSCCCQSNFLTKQIQSFHPLSLEFQLLLHCPRNKILLIFFCITCEAFIIWAPWTLSTLALYMVLMVYTVLSHGTSCVALLVMPSVPFHVFFLGLECPSHLNGLSFNSCLRYT